MISLETVKLTEHKNKYQDKPKENFDTDESEDFEKIFKKELDKNENSNN